MRNKPATDTFEGEYTTPTQKNERGYWETEEDRWYNQALDDVLTKLTERII